VHSGTKGTVAKNIGPSSPVSTSFQSYASIVELVLALRPHGDVSLGTNLIFSSCWPNMWIAPENNLRGQWRACACATASATPGSWLELDTFLRLTKKISSYEGSFIFFWSFTL